MAGGCTNHRVVDNEGLRLGLAAAVDKNVPTKYGTERR
jgi:hypothetical protein